MSTCNGDNSQEEYIRLACKSLQLSLQRILRGGKSAKKRRICDSKPSSACFSQEAQDQAIRAVNHACHLLRMLVTKRISLSLAASAFGQCCKDCTALLTTAASTNATSRHQTALVVRIVLCHWMRQYVRLRDGIILLATGECRHEADIQMAQSESRGGGEGGHEGGGFYKSHFSSKNHRKDGYTCMYSADVYSGYGLDELYDEDVGIRARLIEALTRSNKLNGDNGQEKDEEVDEDKKRKRKGQGDRLWMKLIDNAMLFDNALNQHEAELKAIVANVRSVVRNFFLCILFLKNDLFSCQLGPFFLNVNNRLSK